MTDKNINTNPKWRGAWYTGSNPGQNGDLVTPLGRLQFNNIVKPNTRLVTPENPKPIYGYTLIVENDPEDKFYKDIKAAAKILFMEWSEWLHGVDVEAKKTKLDLKAYRDKLLAGIKYPTFRDGDENSKWEGFEGKLYMNIRIKDPNNVRVSGGRHPEEIEAGMLCRSQVSMYINADGFSYGHRLISIVKDDGVRYAGAGGNSVDLLSGLDEAVDAVKTKEESDAKESEVEEAPKKGVKKTKEAEPSGLDVL